MPSATHEPDVTLANVLATIKDASAGTEARDRRIRALENSVNELLLKMGRPSGGGGGSFAGTLDERAKAVELLEQKQFAATTKRDVSLPEPDFSEQQIAEARLAIAGVRALMHSTSIDQVPLDQRKALSSFSFGSQGFLLAPEMSQTILSCLETTTDIAGLMHNISISGPGIKFMVDNETGGIVLVALDVRLHVLRRHQSHLVPKRAQLPRPVVRRRARLQANQTWRQSTEERQNLRTPKLLAQNRRSLCIDPVHLKNMLRQVQSDRSNLAHGWLPFAADSIRQQFGTQMPQGGHPPHHSMTLSARNSIDSEIESPMAFAAFKLMTNSNFTACSTGRSPGFRPLSTRST